MNKIKFVENLEKNVLDKKIKKINIRHSFNIGVLDSNQNYICTVIIDLYKDLDNNDLCKIEHNIDKQRNYHTIDIEDYTI